MSPADSEPRPVVWSLAARMTDENSMPNGLHVLSVSVGRQLRESGSGKRSGVTEDHEREEIE